VGLRVKTGGGYAVANFPTGNSRPREIETDFCARVDVVERAIAGQAGVLSRDEKLNSISIR